LSTRACDPMRERPRAVGDGGWYLVALSLLETCELS